MRSCFQKSHLIVLLVILSAGGLCYASEKSDTILPSATAFPSATNELKSRDGRYLMTNVDHPDQIDADGNWHSIFLTDRRTGVKKLFYSYDRGVDIKWSPSSDAVVVNDYFGSSMSRSILFVLPPKPRRIDIGEQLSKSDRPRREKLSVSSADHVYPRVLRWIDSDHIILKITGYNGIDQNGFTIEYSYDIAKNSFTLKKYLRKDQGFE
jgi:hypothetical protein